jgi:hypothetical protein
VSVHVDGQVDGDLEQAFGCRPGERFVGQPAGRHTAKLSENFESVGEGP